MNFLKCIPNRIFFLIFILLIFCFELPAQKRARELGIEPGILTPGKWNAITDVEGVLVGQKTLIAGV